VTLYLKIILHTKRAGRMAQGVGPKFKPQYCRSIRRRRRRKVFLTIGI
jgi:hypothetical protein